MVKSGVFREKMQEIDIIFAFQLRQNSFSSIRHFLPPDAFSKTSGRFYNFLGTFFQKHRDFFMNA